MAIHEHEPRDRGIAINEGSHKSRIDRGNRWCGLERQGQYRGDVRILPVLVMRGGESKCAKSIRRIGPPGLQPCGAIAWCSDMHVDVGEEWLLLVSSWPHA